jgi:hypothetical protein
MYDDRRVPARAELVHRRVTVCVCVPPRLLLVQAVRGRTWQRVRLA